MEVIVAREVVGLRDDESIRVLRRDDGREICAHAVLLSLGVSWRMLEAPGCDRLVGCGVYYGAAPRTSWLDGVLARDEEGFVLAGPDLDGVAEWTLDRPRHLLEISIPGVFVAGDVRAGSAKRVGAAVGEGSMAIQFIHNHLRGRK